MKITKSQCDQCLFSPNRIVSAHRAAQIVKECLSKDSYFVCHKATIKGVDGVCCRGFWNRFKDDFNLGRIVQRLGGPREAE